MLMKIKKFCLCLALILCTGFCFSGCAIDPWKVETWYLSGITVDGETTLIESDDFWFKDLFYDSVYFKFTKDRDFEMKTLNGEIKKGKYQLKKTLGSTKLKLEFADGTKGTGELGHFYFDASWECGAITIGDVTYNVYNYQENEFHISKAEWEQKIDDEKAVLKNFLEEGLDYFKVEEDSHNQETIHYYRGEIYKLDGKTMFKDAESDREIEIKRLFEDRLYFYNLETDGSFSKADDLAEGNAIIRFERSPLNMWSTIYHAVIYLL